MSIAHRQLGQLSQALNLLQQCSPPNSQHAENLIALEKATTSCIWEISQMPKSPFALFPIK